MSVVGISVCGVVEDLESGEWVLLMFHELREIGGSETSRPSDAHCPLK